MDTNPINSLFSLNMDICFYFIFFLGSKALGTEKNKVRSFEQLKTFINNSFSILKGDFMDFNYTFPRQNILHWEMRKCFAYEGMKRIRIKEKYECGVIYRLGCWLDVLGVKFKLEPEINECLLHSQESCVGDMIFNI